MQPSIWFPTVKTHTGTDVFTENLVAGLNRLGFKAEITWLPHRAEFAPWSVRVPPTPAWAKIVHTNSWLSTRFMPPVLPVVTTIHHSIHDSRLLPFKGVFRALYHRYWVQYLERANLRRADVVVAVSADAAKLAQKAFGRNHIQVIYNGVELGEQAVNSRVAPNVPFRMIYVGTWMKRKGVDLFSAIMRGLGPGYELVCVGGEPDGADRADLPNNVSLLGRIEDRGRLVVLMQEADAFLFPSRSEGLSLSLVEAQACALPVIAAMCSSMPEVVLDRETGILCQMDDVPAFVEAAKSLANNRDVWRDMRIAAHQRARAIFSLERQVSEYAEVYGSLAANKRI